jgi:putative Mg2+ transporter-C (MgtC) family protein
MALPILDAGINLLAAVGLGAAIGFERQWRQRLAGLRTNTLVALGAATFILFARLAGDQDSAARVGAQVVSGIGFLGAGVIFKEGLNVRGLNTAATLWCSAAVGLLAGMGFILYGALCAALVVGSNVVLRPLVRAINRQPVDDTEVERTYVAYAVCDMAAEPQVRAILMEGLTALQHIEFSELEIANIEDADRVEVTATLTSHKRRELALESIIARLTKERGVSRAGWREHTQSV